jgi:hypothetical protein
MILSVFVVISHITLELLGGVDSSSSSLLYSNLFPRVAGVNGVKVTLLGGEGIVLGSEALLSVAGGLLVVGLGALVLGVAADKGTGTFAVLTLGDVDLGGSVVGGRAVDSLELSIVGLVLDVDVTADVTVERLLVAVDGKGKGQLDEQGRESRGKVETGCRSDNNKGKGLSGTWLFPPMCRGTLC